MYFGPYLLCLDFSLVSEFHRFLLCVGLFSVVKYNISDMFLFVNTFFQIFLYFFIIFYLFGIIFNFRHFLTYFLLFLVMLHFLMRAYFMHFRSIVIFYWKSFQFPLFQNLFKHKLYLYKKTPCLVSIKQHKLGYKPYNFLP